MFSRSMPSRVAIAALLATGLSALPSPEAG
jgi:hypothetical protein